ncbi:MAG TPA: FAD-binding protein [Candidatus Cloacimonetes bacterium]|nr:FAD-binding protein [Candidatus Cloacimonadota bacterium]
MYPESMQKSVRNVEKTRPERFKLVMSGKKIHPMMTEKERDVVLHKFHPDYQPDARKKIRIGPNKGENLTTEIVDLLEAYSRINPKDFDLTKPDYETDVLVVGGGSAGFAAALLAEENGVKVTLVTKLRIGDSNSMMAQGGIQAAVRPNDSPILHYLDAIGGGHFDNKPELVRALTSEAPDGINWLKDLGVMFDRNPDGTMVTKSGGGTSRLRMHSARDYTGAAICSTLRDEILNRPDKIKILEHQPVVELIMDNKGKVSGAVLYHLENKKYYTIKAKAVILSTGGFGRLHIKDFETTNHYGATADGLVLGYRVGAKLMYMDSVQYHPTGAIYPKQILGFLCTEKLRSLGAQPLNIDGEIFVNPLEPRDVESSSFIRECQERKKGIRTPNLMELGIDDPGHVGVWLDTPLIDQINGKGTIQASVPAMVRQFARFGVDMITEPILVYPTLHYQNGGVEINDHCETNIPGLFVSGEASGGVHGRNRLMGNSQLDLIIFGRRSGKFAAEFAKTAKTGKLSLDHVYEYEKEVDKIGIDKKKISPLVLPDYIPDHVKAKQLTAEYHGTLI